MEDIPVRYVIKREAAVTKHELEQKQVSDLRERVVRLDEWQKREQTLDSVVGAK